MRAYAYLSSPESGGEDEGCRATSPRPTPTMSGRSTSSKTKPTTVAPRILTITDEHTREALATPTARRLGADQTVQALEQVAWRRGRAPGFIRCDNGPELVSQALHDWCRFNHATTAYIEPGAPWQNPYAESHGKLQHPPQSPTARRKTGARSTTTTAPTNPSTTKHPPSTHAAKGLKPNQHPHSRWTGNRGPVTPTEHLRRLSLTCFVLASKTTSGAPSSPSKWVAQAVADRRETHGGSRPTAAARFPGRTAPA
jgi:hypothetical protein